MNFVKGYPKSIASLGVISLAGLYAYGTQWRGSQLTASKDATSYPIVPITECPAKKTGECPVSHGTESKSDLVPTNQMPPPNQLPHKDQTKDLPTNRLQSSIPRSDGKNWEYPSEQMFYNALKKKGWEGYSEEDMKGIVSVHNVTNERCWAEILKWELSLHDLKEDPKLVRFRGNFNKISPKAYMKMIFGGAQRPFDRHDWYINRDGTEVHYIIDFYEGAKQKGKASTIHLDVRPAIDSPMALIDRIRMYFGIRKETHQIIVERQTKNTMFHGMNNNNNTNSDTNNENKHH